MNSGAHFSAFIGARCATHVAGNFQFGQWLARGPRHVTRPHGHREAHIVYVLGGEYHTDAEGERARDGSYLIYSPPGTYHSDHMLGAGGFFTISIDEGWLDTLDMSLPCVPTTISDAAPHALVGQLRRRFSQWDANVPTDAESIALELLGAIAARPHRERRPPKWLAVVERQIRDRLRDNISIGELAREINIHPVHLARTFHAVHGCTPSEYVRNRRCELVIELLSHSRKSLAEIAALSGFADQSHLSAVFRRTFGTSPGRFRRIVSS